MLNKYIEKVQRLNVSKKGGRKPHKPLLLLLVLGRYQSRKHEWIEYKNIERQLFDLLEDYAPKVKNDPEPWLPFWYLKSDGFWEVKPNPIDGDFKYGKDGRRPKLESITKASGRLSAELLKSLDKNPSLLSVLVQIILDDHFPHTLHQRILDATQLNISSPLVRSQINQRDPEFRKKVLNAYQYTCAVTGFRAALDGRYFGVQAAHVQWFNQGGPCVVSNGIALEPTMHTLFDRGAWSIDDNYRVLVSALLTGNEPTTERLRELHGKPIRRPIGDFPCIDLEFIHWHREVAKGGVFRHPALP
jgi:putative restriction endonuclease